MADYPIYVAEGAEVTLRFIDQKLIDKILDTETSATVGDLLRYINEKYPINDYTKKSQTYRLYYKNQRLDNDNRTLESYGWVNGTSGKIDVKIEPTDSEIN